MSKLLSGTTLAKKDGSQEKADVALKGKLVAFYFSASWCPPCRKFTPILKDFYEEVGNEELEVVFVSADRSTEDLLQYMREHHGDWYYLPLQSEQNKILCSKYDVSGIPKLIVVREDGGIVSGDARAELMSKSSPSSLLRKWKQSSN